MNSRAFVLWMVMAVLVACAPNTPTPPTLDPTPPPVATTTLPAQPAPTEAAATQTLPASPIAELPATPTPDAVFPTATQGASTINLPIIGSGGSATATTEPAGEVVVATTPTLPTTPSPTEIPAPPRNMTLRDDLPAMPLEAWERPAGDNGRCMHWLRNQYFTAADMDVNMPRMQQLNAKWVLVVYADENIIHMAAPRFAEAGIVPIWRKMLRPFEPYYDWQRDIDLVKSYGLPPYFQIYNEPSLGQEWVDSWEGPADEQLFLDNLIQASQDVYNAGGYVGWQSVDQTWLSHMIDEVERRNGTKIFERFFFIAHSYGDNIPPNWTEDGRGVLGWRYYTDLLRQRLGFVPPIIVGEGGWRINSLDEPRFPQMDDATHARYHVELFDWFRTGTLSNGDPLPDFLFAYCPWLIAEKGDDNAWWDSFAGDRLQTIQAINAMPPFVRRSSWSQ